MIKYDVRFNGGPSFNDPDPRKINHALADIDARLAKLEAEAQATSKHVSNLDNRTIGSFAVGVSRPWAVVPSSSSGIAGVAGQAHCVGSVSYTPKIATDLTDGFPVGSRIPRTDSPVPRTDAPPPPNTHEAPTQPQRWTGSEPISEAIKAAAAAETLVDIVRDYVWTLYYAGIEENGFWRDGGSQSDGAALRALLELEDGRHDADEIKAKMPALVDRLCDKVAREVITAYLTHSLKVAA